MKEKFTYYPSIIFLLKKTLKVFILKHNYSADQSRFLKTVQIVFVQRRKLELAALYEKPFTNFRSDAINKLFTEEDVNELIYPIGKLIYQ